MSFMDAVKTCLTKYVDFNGRARRSEYWYFCLFDVVVSLIAAILVKLTGVAAISWIVTLAFCLPGLAVSVRRLHDIGKRWTWLLMVLIPLAGPIILIVYFVKDSQPGDNQFGPNPKN